MKRNCSATGSPKAVSTKRTGPTFRSSARRFRLSAPAPGQAARSIGSSSFGSREQTSRRLPKPMRLPWRADYTSTSPACRRRSAWPSAWPATLRRRRTLGWWTSCWHRRGSASAWRRIGSTSSVTPTPSATTAIRIMRLPHTATGSSRRSTTTCRSTSSPPSNSPATCCPTRR